MSPHLHVHNETHKKARCLLALRHVQPVLCRLVQRTESAEAGVCAPPPRAPSPSEPNNGCGCSLIRRDVVEQFPGDICGGSLGMPPLPSPPHSHPPFHPRQPHTLLLFIRRAGPQSPLGPSEGRLKRRLLLQSDGRLRLSSHSQEGK